MLYLVNDILDYSQIESQNLILNLEEVTIDYILKDCIDVLRFKAEQKGLDLSYQIDERFPRKFLTDQNRLRQILINLLSNGIKYTTSGYVKLNAVLTPINKKIQIEVEDSGVGIEESE